MVNPLPFCDEGTRVRMTSIQSLNALFSRREDGRVGVGGTILSAPPIHNLGTPAFPHQRTFIMAQDLVASLSAERGYSQVALEAALEAIARQSRHRHPAGKFGSAGRFYLSETCTCCENIREPSRQFPSSQNDHGRTSEHVAHLFGVPPLHVKRLVKALKCVTPCESAHERMRQATEIGKILKRIA